MQSPCTGLPGQRHQSSSFREKDCTLKKALEALQISEATQEQLKDMGSEDHPNAVSQNKKGAKYAANQRLKNP